MTRFWGVAAVLMLAATGPAAPVPKPAKPKPPDVTDTVWVCDETAVNWGVVEYTFQAGGKVLWNRGGRTTHVGGWKQDGDKLTWDVDGLEYSLTFAGERFEGESGKGNSPRRKVAITSKAEKK